MSGGYFSDCYSVPDEVKKLIEKNKSTILNEWGEKEGYFFCPEVIDEFKRGYIFIRIAEIYKERIDYLVSGDDGENTFIARLAEDTRAFLEEE
jgi:hypothetical protein